MAQTGRKRLTLGLTLEEIGSRLQEERKTGRSLPSKRKDEDGEDKVFRLDSRDHVRRCLSTVAGKLKSANRLFQQDGARSHVAKGTIAYLRRNGIDFVHDWPPEWNAIERVWAILLDRVGRRCPMTSEELVRVVHE